MTFQIACASCGRPLTGQCEWGEEVDYDHTSVDRSPAVPKGTLIRMSGQYAVDVFQGDVVVGRKIYSEAGAIASNPEDVLTDRMVSAGEQISFRPQSPPFCGRCETINVLAGADGSLVIERGHWAGNYRNWERRREVRQITPGQFAAFRGILEPYKPDRNAPVAEEALRARHRQYEVRSLIEARERAAAELERLVVERTGELQAANRELKTQMDERLKVEETLRQTQKIEAIGQLTGGVAHDFNNLLMVIAGGLDMLDRTTDERRRRRLMEGMRQAAQRGSSLTRQLLAFSRRQSLTPEPVDLAHQIGGMSELLERSLRGDIHVKLDFPRGLWPVEVDPGELELVLLNLAVNARDAMPEGGRITVQARNWRSEEYERDFVELTVADTGTGIPDEVVERVFDPFFTTKDIGKGSGLGLAQVHGFAAQSGGSVRIETVPGEGTKVILLLPRSRCDPVLPDHSSMDTQVADQTPISKGNVLLVEDDDEVAALVSEMLAQLGYNVVRAASAPAALGALADGRSVDVVFSDIMMPGGMNGVDLARELHRRRPDIPVLLTSGYAEAARRDAEAANIPILRKPYQVDDLAAALGAALQTDHLPD